MLSFSLIESRLCLREQNKIKLDGSIKLNAILNESQRTNSMYVRVFVRYNSVRVQYIVDVLTYKMLQLWGHLGVIMGSVIPNFLFKD